MPKYNQKQYRSSKVTIIGNFGSAVQLKIQSLYNKIQKQIDKRYLLFDIVINLEINKFNNLLLFSVDLQAKIPSFHLII